MTDRVLARLNKAGARQGERWLVRDVSLTIEPGKIVALIGPNGAGKSTTARIILGLLTPDEGVAWRRPGLSVGYVPQKLMIDWTLPLSVERFMRLTQKLDRASLDRALESTGVLHLRKSEMRSLSGGEFQRVMLARATARRPDLLVLDEPVQGVDFNGEIALYELISQFRDDLDCGILMISHNLHMVMGSTDYVVCLNGHVCCHGTPTTVTGSQAYRHLFGEQAPGALALYHHNHHHNHTAGECPNALSPTGSDKNHSLIQNGGESRIDHA